MFAIWILIKLITPKTKVRYSYDGCHYDFNNDIIYVDLDQDDDGFIQHLKASHHYKNEMGLTIWTILHEIGHRFTYGGIDRKRDTALRIMYKCLYKKGQISRSEWQEAYHDLKSEWIATEWAINYIENHKTLCKIFNRLLEA